MADVQEQQNRLKQQTARLSVFSNSALVILKLVVGLYTGAVSIISEAAHSAVDLIAALVAFYAVRQAGKPPDVNHAYGHGKIENLSGAIEAVLILAAAIWIVWESVAKFNTVQTPVFLEYGISIMLISMVVNYWVSSKLLAVARETRSHALEADALHLRADIWTSAGVMLGLIVMRITGLSWLDPAIAILVAMVVFKAGYDMTKKSFYELTDISLPAADEQVIVNILNSEEAVLAFHRLRTRRSGGYRLIDVHIVLDRHISLEQAHSISDQIEYKIKEKLAMCDVIIHVEPCGYKKDWGNCPTDGSCHCEEKE